MVRCISRVWSGWLVVCQVVGGTKTGKGGRWVLARVVSSVGLGTGGNTGGGVAPRLAVSTLSEGLLLGIDMILQEVARGLISKCYNFLHQDPGN